MPSTSATLLSYAATVVSFLISSVVIILAPSPALASLEEMCDRAALRASETTNVPFRILQAITRTETGRTRSGDLVPWPWTVNMEGSGHWFETQDAAQAFVFRHFKQGARSFDLGCFQVNYRWHGKGFTSINQMFDPDANALYAARFLRSLYVELGSWKDAAGAFHSRTPVFADAYKQRFQKIYSDLGEDGESAPVLVASSDPPQEPRQNLYPLLRRSGAASSRGSLVPLAQSAEAVPMFGARAPLAGQ